MRESGRIGVKAVSTVIAAVIVLTIFLGLASAIYAGIFQLGNESGNLVKREAERAMESFFQIYWLNETHVVLFNNHSSVPVTLLYWVTVNPATGQYTVKNLDPSTYTVPPGTMRIVENFEKRGDLFPLNRVVSEKGSTFEVTDAPTELHTLIYFTPTEKIVRPGFNGRLTTFVVSTGPDFGGGDVTITCINIIRTDTPTPITLPCTDWGISFDPAIGTVNVPAGAARALGVNAQIPPTFNQYGFYVVKLRLQSSSFTREYSVRVIVTDFSAAVTPGTVTLRGCIGTVLLVFTYSTAAVTYTGHININITAPTELVVWADPNPAAPRPTTSVTTVGQIIVQRKLVASPTGTITSPLTIALSDGLGETRSTVFTVVHAIDFVTIEVRINPPPGPPTMTTITMVSCP
jgi:hypothetical protein